MTGKTMSNMAQKTPISLLQELCAQQTLTPDYKLMSVEGAVHAPTFMYMVQVGDVAATATGASKKKAKHAVAKAVLEKLLTKEGGFEDGFESDGVTITAESLKEFNIEPAPIPCSDDNAAGNPVGRLQELCMKNRWQPPLYETEDESGLPHERVFRIACHVERFREIGKGKSKKLAKRQAADNMLQKLEQLNLTAEKKETTLDEETKCAPEQNVDSSDDSEDIQKKEESENTQEKVSGNAQEKESGNAQEKESGDTQEKEESGNTEEKEESGNTEEKEESGNTEEKEESGNAQEKESGNAQEKESGNAQEKEESGNTQEKEESENTQDEEKSENTQDEEKCGNIQHEGKSGNIQDEVKSGNTQEKEKSEENTEEKEKSASGIQEVALKVTEL